MKLPLLALLLFSVVVVSAPAQVRPASSFQISEITRKFIPAPQFSYSGAEQYQTDQRQMWLEVEVGFSSVPELTNELTFKYYILIGGKLLTGEVTHVNILAGPKNRSVMYVAPRTLAKFLGNKAMIPNSIENIAVQIVQQGAVKDESSVARAQPQWYTAIPQVAGFVLNKNETPFAPLYWERYEQIKSSPSR